MKKKAETMDIPMEQTEVLLHTIAILTFILMRNI